MPTIFIILTATFTSRRMQNAEKSSTRQWCHAYPINLKKSSGTLGYLLYARRPVEGRNPPRFPTHLPTYLPTHPPTDRPTDRPTDLCGPNFSAPVINAGDQTESFETATVLARNVQLFCNFIVVVGLEESFQKMYTPPPSFLRELFK